MPGGHSPPCEPSPVAQPKPGSADLLRSLHWSCSLTPAFVSNSALRAWTCYLVISSMDAGRQASLPRVSGTDSSLLSHPPCSKASALAAIQGIAFQAILPHWERPWHWPGCSGLASTHLMCSDGGLQSAKTHSAVWKAIPVLVQNFSTLRIPRCYWGFTSCFKAVLKTNPWYLHRYMGLCKVPCGSL